jgi:hypothetical protein
MALGDHALHADFHEARGVRVHPIGRRGPGGTDDVAGLGGARPDIVDEAPFDVEWEWMALVEALDHPFVGGVAGRVDDAGEAHAVTDFEALDHRVGQRGRQFVLGHWSTPIMRLLAIGSWLKTPHYPKRELSFWLIANS